MNLFQLIVKQMRQRLLSTCVTTISILLGMMLATSILILQREGRSVFAQTDYGFEMIVGPKASPMQLVFNTLFHIDTSPGNIPYRLYEQIAPDGPGAADASNPFHGLAAWAVPYAVGDSYKGRSIIGTSPQLFGVDDAGKPLPERSIPHFRGDEAYGFSQGRPFASNKFEAVIGAEVAKSTGLAVGDMFHATHGFPGPSEVPDIHEETWTVVGILNETHTANDRVLFIPLLTFYAIFEHESGLEKINAIQSSQPASKPAPAASTEPEEKAYTLNADGTINVKLPRKEWEISAILVQTRSPKAFLDMRFALQNLPDAIGVSPAGVMAQFFDTFLPKITLLLIIISALVTIVAALSILVSIYNSVATRTREIAILRALGATRQRILAAVCLEAGIIATAGGILGLVAGHLLAAAGSVFLAREIGTGIEWWRLGAAEFVYLAAVIAGGFVAGLVPAAKAYRTPVAENLVSS